MKLLYITFIDFGNAASGSSVRPQKMYEAFAEMGVEIKLLQGQQNNFKQRKRNVLEILRWLDENRPDICYVEPPSGPFFNWIDLRLLCKLKRMSIPVGLFYRDMHWKFGMHSQNGAASSLKAFLVHIMHIRDWQVFMNTLSVLYFPTRELASVLKSRCIVKMLPPGCFRATGADDVPTESSILTGLYVGGVTDLYNPLKLIRAAEKINADTVLFRLKLICREAEWKRFLQENNLTLNNDWIEVIHASGDELLREQYKTADFTLCPLKATDYGNVAIPVKIMEYLSYLKPVVATNCTAMKAFIQQYDIGILTEDTIEGLASGILRMIEDKGLREHLRDNCVKAREENLWICRAQTVVQDLAATK